MPVLGQGCEGYFLPFRKKLYPQISQMSQIIKKLSIKASMFHQVLETISV
jgi:hypothetical protein